MGSSRRISHYELLETIGRDGPTEIYRAHDTRLDRDVAVRVLRHEETAQPEAVERFRRESRIASLVTHPNICAVHDSGEDEGRPYIVSELLEGLALDQVLAASEQPLERVLDIGVQLANALAATHRRGIVHGNVKPSNVFITTDGHVKLLELGGAAAVVPAQHDRHDTADSDTTAAAVISAVGVGAGEFFHAYIAPEQISGGAQQRSDIFALGALLYEMTTGTPAFSGRNAAEIAAAITLQTPVRPRSIKPRIPKALERIILRALEKDLACRFQTAEELREHLCRARRAAHTSRRVSASGLVSQWPRHISIPAAAVLVLILVGGTRSYWRQNVQTYRAQRAILVSQIANGTGDSDFDGTLRQAVTVYLDQSPFLDLVSDERIRATLQLMGRDGDTHMTHDIAAGVCERLGLEAMLEGSVSAVGRSTVIALVATDCTSRRTIAREQVEIDKKEDVLRALGSVTASLRRALGESGATLARHNVPIEEATTPSMEALKAYTDAVARRAEGQESEAVILLERAVVIDPQFALAYATLSSIFGGFGETGRSEEYARLAFDNRSRVSERERLFITYQYHDRVTGDQLKAREALEVWKAMYPRDYRPANALAVLLNRLGDYRQAAVEATEAIQRNPAHAFPRSNLAFAYRGAGRFDAARTVVDDALARKLETTPMRRLRYQLAEIDGDTSAAQQQLDWAEDRPRSFDMLGARAQVFAYRGTMEAARQMYADVIASAKQRGFAQVASGYAAQAALAEAVYGCTRQAINGSREVLRIASSFEPQLRAAAVLALAGDAAGADEVLGRLRGVRPNDTLLQHTYFPIARAAVLIAQDRFDAAVEVLRPASTYERGAVAALLPMYLRALARLRAGSDADAIRDFQEIIDQRGVDPFSPLLPMSQLGLARALARAGRDSESRKAYEQFLQAWSSADSSVPVLVQARRELSRLDARK